MTLELSATDLSKLRDVEAAREAQLKTVNVMLSARADPNVRTHTGHSALFVACQRGASDVVRSLLAAGADATVAAAIAGSDQKSLNAQQIAAALGANGHDVSVGLISGMFSGELQLSVCTIRFGGLNLLCM